MPVGRAGLPPPNRHPAHCHPPPPPAVAIKMVRACQCVSVSESVRPNRRAIVEGARSPSAPGEMSWAASTAVERNNPWRRVDHPVGPSSSGPQSRRDAARQRPAALRTAKLPNRSTHPSLSGAKSFPSRTRRTFIRAARLDDLPPLQKIPLDNAGGIPAEYL